MRTELTMQTEVLKKKHPRKKKPQLSSVESRDAMEQSKHPEHLMYKILFSP